MLKFRMWKTCGHWKGEAAMALAQNCGIPATEQGRELVQHGSALFPIACYEERLTCYSVPWHWHEDFEYI